ncbi:MAG: hypothetical protein HY329_06030 [Chloroflexi bacterium]|nr:hypothetical protein [Chloroflexota bacterium]
MSAKETLHRLVNQLPECALEEAERLLTLLADPVFRAFAEAPEDDELLTPEDVAALGEGKADLARGEWSPWAEVELRLFGSSQCPGR